MNESELKDYILSFAEVEIDTNTEPSHTIYKTLVDKEPKIFALILNNSKPVQITLKCDRLLAKKLRAEYESVMPAQNMNKHLWNRIVCSGQLTDDDTKDLVNLSYHLVKNNS